MKNSCWLEIKTFDYLERDAFSLPPPRVPLVAPSRPAVVGRVVGLNLRDGEQTVAYVDIGEVNLLSFDRLADVDLTEGSLVAVVDAPTTDGELWAARHADRTYALATSARLAIEPERGDEVYTLSPMFRVGHEVSAELARSQQLQSTPSSYSLVGDMPVFSSSLSAGELRGISPLVERAIEAQRGRTWR